MSIDRVMMLAAAAVFATAAYAANPSAATDASTRPDAGHCPAVDSAPEPLPVGAGLRAFIDPRTGELRQPTAEELASMAASSRFSQNKSIDGLKVEYRSDGSKFVHLKGRFMHSMVVTRNADGAESFTCTDRAPHTHPHQNPPPASSAPTEK